MVNQLAILCKRYCFYIIALVLLCNHRVEAQASNPDNQLKYIDILPPSPAVAKLGEFSRPDIGMSSGTAQFNLPLTQLSVSNFSIPIGLNYSSNGVKVDEISSRVGMGFQLEAGGAITRAVSGKGPDEKTVFLPAPDVSPTSREFVNYMRSIAESNGTEGSLDSELDVFNYSFCGMGGKFVIDNDDNAIQIPKTNSKIITNFGSTSWTFKIIDSRGNQFYFGGTGYIEKSWKSSTCAKQFADPIPTAWFLQKCELYNGDIITFSYQAKSYKYDLGVNQTMYYQLLSQSQPRYQSDCNCPVYPDDVCINFIDVDTYYLTGITTARGHAVNLVYDTRLDCNDVLLKSIVSRYSGTTVESYDLSYDHITTTSFGPPSLPIPTSENQHRYFLKSVKKLPSDASAPLTLYSLTYNDPASLPVRLSFAQDDWGYFNGKNNGSLVPKPNQPDIHAKFPNATGNRDVDTVFAKKGMLVKIVYPTGGYDTITYESNKHYTVKQVYPTATTTFGGNVTGTGFNTTVEKNLGTFTVGFGQKVKIRLIVTNMTGQTPVASQTGNVSVGNGAGTGTTFGTLPGTELTQEHIWPAGVYSVDLKASGSIAKAEVIITYIPGQMTNVTKNWPVGGSRVAQIKSYSYDKKLVGKRKFEYNITGTSQSSAVLRYNIDYLKNINYLFYCGIEVESFYYACWERPCEYLGLFSSALSNIFNSAGNSVSYGTVFESFDDAKGNGMIEHKFMVSNDAQGQLLIGNSMLGSTPTNTSVFNHGKEQETTYYTWNGTTFSPVSRTRNYYSFEPHYLYNEFSGCVVNRLYDECSPFFSGDVHPHELAPYEVTKYLTYSPWLLLDSTVVEDLSGANKLSKSTIYFYNDRVSLAPTELRTTDSKGDLTQTFNYYSNLSRNPPGATNDDLTLLNTLQNQNANSQLVYQKTASKNTFTGSYRLLFQVNGATSAILPWQVKTSVVSGTEDTEFTILKYDNSGNILERKKKDGIVHSYIWDYNNNYPAAEVKGAYSNEIAATSFETTNLGGWAATPLVNSTTETTSPTGGQVYKWTSAGGTLSKSGLTAAKIYVVSYWYKGSTQPTTTPLASSAVVTNGKDGWKCVTARVTGATTITLNVGMNILVDEVRLYPDGAQMTTLTFSPLVGLTSINDTNNIISYYEYDGFKRLIRARDYKGNLISTNQYNYFSLD